MLDRWEDGETLSQRLTHEALGRYALTIVMKGLAQGLSALHEHDVIRREQSPDCVLLRRQDDRPILCDLELSKLTDGAPTVSPDDWPDDPYRAMEVGGDAPIDARADLYSWGRIFVHAATGKLPGRGEESLAEVRLPDGVREIVMQCVAVPRSQRPTGMKSVLKALKTWS